MLRYCAIPVKYFCLSALTFCFAIASANVVSSQEPDKPAGQAEDPSTRAATEQTPEGDTNEADQIYSGPLAGEPVPELKVWALEYETDETIQLVPPVDPTRPLMVVFVHERTRPGFAVLRGVAKYAEQLQQLLEVSFVFLTDDVVETRQWAKVAKRSLPSGVRLAVSPDGQEGPGAWGLNRNVNLTVVVAKSGQVTKNMAIVQPSANTDLLNITQAMAAAAEVEGPSRETLASWIEQPAMNRNATAPEVDIRPLLAPVIRLTATVEDVAAAAKNVEVQAAKDESFRIAVGTACRRIVAAGKLENYGTAEAQRHLRSWADTFQ